MKFLLALLPLLMSMTARGAEEWSCKALAPLYRTAGQEARLKLAELPGLGHDWTTPEARGPVASLINDWLRTYP